MAYQIEERQSAARDVVDAVLWYQRKRVILGSQFLEALDRLYDKLATNPHAYGVIQNNFREGLLDTFPYSVVFEIEDEKIVVYRVFNTAQDPSKKFEF